jgi:hypothetical protein
MSDPDGNFEIYLMDVDGAGLVNLTHDLAFDGFPTWSPDGSRIAFRTDRDGNAEIYVMNADGTGLVNLTENAAFDGNPVSPTVGSAITQPRREPRSLCDERRRHWLQNVTNHPAFDGIPHGRRTGRRSPS